VNHTSLWLECSPGDDVNVAVHLSHTLVVAEHVVQVMMLPTTLLFFIYFLF